MSIKLALNTGSSEEVKMRRLFLLAIICVPAWACSCGGYPSVKDAWLDSPLVFGGLVDKTDPKITSDIMAGEQTAWVRVIEPFKGVTKDQVLELRDQFSSCFGGFREGTELLFYLHPGQKQGTWVAPACHRSRSLSAAADDLLFLRALPRSATTNRLSGEINLYEESPSFRRVQAFPGLRVTISNDTRSVDTYTNADGVYEVYGLSPGTYTVNIDMPPGLKLQFPIITGSRELVPRNTTVSLGEQTAVGVDFVLIEANAISGVLLTPDGKPLRGACLNLEPADQQPATRGRISGCSKQDGYFELKDMPAGRYVIVGNKSGRISISEPFPTAYYPGVLTRAAAEVIDVARGKSIEGLRFRLPTMARQVAVRGRIQFSDGVPVPNAYLKHSSKDQTFTRSDADGRFNLKLLAERRGELTAEIMVIGSDLEKCPHWRPEGSPKMLVTLTSSPAPISGENDQNDVLLTMPMRSCSAWPSPELR